MSHTTLNRFPVPLVITTEVCACVDPETTKTATPIKRSNDDSWDSGPRVGHLILLRQCKSGRTPTAQPLEITPTVPPSFKKRRLRHARPDQRKGSARQSVVSWKREVTLQCKSLQLAHYGRFCGQTKEAGVHPKAEVCRRADERFSSIACPERTNAYAWREIRGARQKF